MPAHSELGHWSKSFINWLVSLELACSAGQSTLQLLIQDLQSHRQQLVQITKEIRKQISTSHVRIAKKLLSRIRYVWIKQIPYVPAVVE
jgi:hypothetical protein